MVLLGHSMGGLLAAEVVLLAPYSPATGQAVRHRLLGTVNFDVPFLGLHPGVIGSGIASLFRPAEKQVDADSSPQPASPSSTTLDANVDDDASTSSGRKRHDTLYSQPEDPNFNPAFSNDVNLKVRKGWKSFAHFINKHSDGLRQATAQYVKSHIEFGGAMADYPSLRARYSKIRALEEEDESLRQTSVERPARSVPRVRFVNYYTASTGRAKREKGPSPSRHAVDGTLEPPETKRSASTSPSGSRSSSRSPRISIEEQRDDGEVVVKEVIDPVVSPTASEEESQAGSKLEGQGDATSPAYIGKTFVTTNLLSNLPPLPEEPTEPPPLDMSSYPDKDVQKVVQRQYDRHMKAYKQAVKDRNDAIRDREKLIEKLRKSAIKEDAKKIKSGAPSTLPPLSTEPASTGTDGAQESVATAPNDETKENQKQSAGIHQSALDTASVLSRESSIVPSVMSSTTADSHSQLTSLTSLDLASATTIAREAEQPPAKAPKDRKFCVLAKGADGKVDRCWVRVPMPGLDEVGAHCGLFVSGDGDHYDRLVGDVGGRIEDWVREDLSAHWEGEPLD